MSTNKIPNGKPNQSKLINIFVTKYSLDQGKLSKQIGRY